MTVLECLHEGKENAVTREELVMLTGMPDRAVRSEIERLRREHVILNDQDGKGYYIETDCNRINRYIRQEEARAKSIFASLKAARRQIKEKAPVEAGTSDKRSENKSTTA